MPAVRPTLEYTYQHREFRHKLIPPYGRSCPPQSGPKFRPTRPIYDEATDHRDNIRRILLQRRRVDGKTTLSDVRSIERGLDTSGLHTDEEVRDMLIPLLDHENLVRLMDIQFAEASQVHVAIPGFENMSRGTLNRILFEKVAIPESLCWHVLEGVTNALLWLHYGYSNSRQKKDWSPIALINIHPGSIYFTAPRDDETYGIAKVSNFDNAMVMPKGQNAYDAIRVPNHTREDLGYYVAPELVCKQATAALVSDIYSLGATLYHMMLGQPPQEVDLSHETTTEPAGRDTWVIALPPDTTYSPNLKRIVREMLRTSRRRRPDAATLHQNLVADMEVWRSESAEGRRYVRRRKEVEDEEEKIEKGGEEVEGRVREGHEEEEEREEGKGKGKAREEGKTKEGEKTRGGGKTRGGEKTRGGGRTREWEEEGEGEEEGEREQARGKGKTRGGEEKGKGKEGERERSRGKGKGKTRGGEEKGKGKEGELEQARGMGKTRGVWRARRGALRHA